MQLQLKLDNLKEAMSKKLTCNIRMAERVFMHMPGINKTCKQFLMAEDLNGYFSSVFIREYTSSLLVPDAKFQEAKSDFLGPLIVTPEMVAKKIKAMKDNKSPGVDGIPPNLLIREQEQ